MAYTTIDDPSEYFQILAYTGNGANNRALVNTGNSDMQPDWLWIKRRNSAEDAAMYDSSRGIDGSGNSLRLRPARDDAEITGDTSLDSFNSDGFTIDSGDQVNGNNSTYVAWQWKVNGGTVATNTAGTNIDTTEQVNALAGISILKYVGTGTDNDSLGHSLGAAPDAVIIKNRDETNGWQTFHKNNTTDPKTDVLNLNSNNPTTDNDTVWSDVAPSSSVITLGTNDGVSKGSVNYVGYVFKGIKGFSKFGGYTGNGNVKGTYVHTGFQPALIIVKKVDETQNWPMFDTTLRPRNLDSGAVDGNDFMYADLANAEDQTPQFEIYSNGFRPTMTSDLANGDGHPYVYFAWAKHPFVTSKGTPITAGR